MPYEKTTTMEAKGRCLIEGLPKMIDVSSQELLEAIEEPVTSIVNAVCAVIERTPPGTCRRYSGSRLVMTGGGSQLFGLDKLIEHVTGIRTFLAENPEKCVAIGAGRSLDNLSSKNAGHNKSGKAAAGKAISKKHFTAKPVKKRDMFHMKQSKMFHHETFSYEYTYIVQKYYWNGEPCFQTQI